MYHIIRCAYARKVFLSQLFPLRAKQWKDIDKGGELSGSLISAARDCRVCSVSRNNATLQITKINKYIKSALLASLNTIYLFIH